MANQRSPNYPGFGLDVAVQLVKQLYTKERKGAVPPWVVAKALGYEMPSGKLSGNALTKIASLRQYGLVEKAGVGKLKVSDLALDFVLHSPDDREYRSAAKTAALTPALFKQLFDELGEGSDDALNAHLIKDLDFSPEGSARVIKAYRDTLEFAKLAPGSYNGDVQEDKPGDSGADVREEKPGKGSRPKTGEASVAYSWPLGGGNKVELGFANEPTQAQLDVMLAQLQIMRNVAPEGEPPSKRPGGSAESD